MLASTRNWFRRNRTPIAVGVGVVGAGYVAVQYFIAKIRDDRERMSSERIAKENLRRRFEQNQEDCTFTVLALLPTATTNILEHMDTERITYEIQQLRGTASVAKSTTSLGSTTPPSITDTALLEDDGKSMMSFQSESGIHASQMTLPPHPSFPILSANSGDGVALSVEASKVPLPAETSPFADTADPPTIAIESAVPLPAETTADAAMAAATQTANSTAVAAAAAAVASVATLQTQSAIQKARKTKRQLWDELAISSITRAFTLIYTLALLTMFTRVQLNLLGRRSYLSSVVSLAAGSANAGISLENNDDDNTEQAYGSDFETNRKYLAFSWWLLNRGWIEIRDRVEAAVRRAFGHLSPRDAISLDVFAELTSSVRQQVERGPNRASNLAAAYSQTTAANRSPWLSSLLPPVDQEELVIRESGILPTTPTYGPPAATTPPTPADATPLRRLLDETADLVESPAFSRVLTLLLDTGFNFLLDSRLATMAFDLPPIATPANAESPAGLTSPSAFASERAILRAERRVLLPKTLSVLTRQAHAIGNGVANEYLQEMERVGELESFAAVVYSSNWENEILPHDDSSEAKPAGTTTARSTIPGAAYAHAGVPATPTATIVSVDPIPMTSPVFNPLRLDQSQTIGDSVVIVGAAESQGAASLESAWGRAIEHR